MSDINWQLVEHAIEQVVVNRYGVVKLGLCTDITDALEASRLFEGHQGESANGSGAREVYRSLRQARIETASAWNMGYESALQGQPATSNPFAADKH